MTMALRRSISPANFCTDFVPQPPLQLSFTNKLRALSFFGSRISIPMASASSSSPSLQLHTTLRKPFLSPNHSNQLRPRLPLRSSFNCFHASASSSLAIEPERSFEGRRVLESDDVFACPVCYEPLIRIGPSGLNLGAIFRSGFKCEKCKKWYSSKDMYLDLTVTAGLRDYTELRPAMTELFRSPLVSFLYERGWRQNFSLSGFPGPDEEFKMAQDYFQSVQGGLIIDVSCGSGLFSRKFSKSDTYSAVIALDFSENMLRQCYDFIKRDNTLLDNNLALVRADISRLPFSSASIDAVHAGAALHCWPSPSNAIAEITRVLRSGGVFVGTTFLRYTSSTPIIIRPFRERALQPYSYLNEDEIEDLCKSCGLTNYSSKVEQSFIMFSAQKP